MLQQFGAARDRHVVVAPASKLLHHRFKRLPVTPTIFQTKPFGQQVEGLSLLRAHPDRLQRQRDPCQGKLSTSLASIKVHYEKLKNSTIGSDQRGLLLGGAGTFCLLGLIGVWRFPGRRFKTTSVLVLLLAASLLTLEFMPAAAAPVENVNAPQSETVDV